ncbi:MAG: PAS domain-containing protein [Gemmatimonadales bacterium]
MRERRIYQRTPTRWAAEAVSGAQIGWVGRTARYQTPRAAAEDRAGRVEHLSAEIARLQLVLAQLQRFRTLIDRAGEAIFVADAITGRIVDVNETACSWLGLTRKRLLALSVSQLDLDFPLDCQDAVGEHVTETRMLGRPFVYGAGSHRRRNGTSFPVEVAISRVSFGESEYMLTVARECTDRRRAEEALHESEDRYRALFEFTHDAIYVSARDGTVADVNEAATRLFGYSREEFLRLDARQLYVDPHDIRAFREGVEENGCVRDRFVEFRTRDGERFCGLLTVTLRHGGGGEIMGYQCLVHRSSNGSSPLTEPTCETTQPHSEAPLEIVLAMPSAETGDGSLGTPSPPHVVEELPFEHAPSPSPPEETQVVVGTIARRIVEEIVERPLSGDSAGAARRVVTEAPVNSSNIVTHGAPRRSWTAAAFVGVALLAFSWLTLRFYPFSYGTNEWLITSQLIGLSLVALGVSGRRERRTARGLALVLVLLAVVVFVAYASYLTGLPFELRNVVPAAWPSIKAAIARVSVFAIGFASTFGCIAWYLWRETREPEPGVREA